MKQIKKIMLTVVALMLVLPSFLVTATGAENNINSVQEEINPISAPLENSPSSEGKISSKDEVVYATLSATGAKQHIYVVNTLNVSKAGSVFDYGDYRQLKNLTDLSEITQTGDKVEMTVPEGLFFYQGNLNSATLPWDINISYYLNGKETSPEQLAGKDGRVKINIETLINDGVASDFAENYMLQISVPLEEDVFSNIVAEDGMIANVGKNKQVTFTVMPEKTGEFTVEADVTNFKLAGIEITGIPSSISIDEPDVGDMKDDLNSLSDAITQLNDGVAELNSGVTKLNDGTTSLQDGSEQYKSGLKKINSASTEVVGSSKQIKNALSVMATSLPEDIGIDQKDLTQIVEALNEIATGLIKTADGLKEFKGYYNKAYKALDSAIQLIPDSQLTEEELGSLYSSGANIDVVNKLLETYEAALTVKGVYAETKQVFAAVDPTLTEVIAGLEEMSSNLQLVAEEFSAALGEMTESFKQLDELFSGIKKLANNYDLFHDGLINYTSGIDEIAQSYSGIHNGIVELSGGTANLDEGVVELQDGTKELHESTHDLPDQMQTEIDEMMSDYDKSDFKAISFVSNKNENINNVQFVLKTESIKADDSKLVEQPKKEKEGFWARLLNLFR